MSNNYLNSATKQFAYYKRLGDSAMAQLPDQALFWQYNEESNSIAVIVSHLAGNMLSRFTDFLTSDGEKSWRNRDQEFEILEENRASLLLKWEKGWACLFAALEQLTDTSLAKIIYIRNEGHTVMEAINRQLGHYPYHVGQIVFIAKLYAGKNWESLSIPKNQSAIFNEAKFAREKDVRHFTDDKI